MRTKCPVCDSEYSVSNWKMKFEIPDDWTLPNEVVVKVCVNCGFIYYDSDSSQADYDKYYKDRYGFGCYGDALHQTRLDGLAKNIKEVFPWGIRIADFGGGDSYLIRKLWEHGFEGVNWDLGDDVPINCDLVVASHTIEHIYDLDDCIRTLKSALVKGGKLLIEVPDEYKCSFQNTPPILDYNWVHINHFAPFHLDLLFHKHGFSKVWGKTIEYLEGSSVLAQYCYRACYELDYHVGMYERTHKTITANMENLAKKLSEIVEPVVVWGCGAIMSHLLTIVDLDVAYFVDNDTKSFPEGTYLQGKPVFDTVSTDHPIVVCAMGQKQGILNRIKSLGLKNRVIVVDL